MNKDKSIAFQSALKAGTELTAALITAGHFPTIDPAKRTISIDDVISTVQGLQQAFFADTVAIQEQEAAEQPSAPVRSFGGGGNNGGAPGDTVLNFGKYNGKTIAAVFSENPGYVKDFLTKSRNEFIANKVQAFIAALG